MMESASTGSFLGFSVTSSLLRRRLPVMPLAHLHVVGDVAIHAFDINQLSLPTPFYSVLVFLKNLLV